MPQRQLRDAIAAGDLDLHYQPIVSMSDGQIVGVEALLRLKSGPDSWLLPDDFLPAVAHTPVMHEVTRWVVDHACADARDLEPYRISVNVAAVDVIRPTLVDVVAEALARHDVPASRLTIELTEHAAVQGMDQAIQVLEQLRGLGIALSLDDFGTGYSSLLYLRDLPVSQVKIDRTFVSGVVGNDDDGAIVRSVVQLAHRVGLSVVAEGVESEDQLRFLKSAQCDFAQGYLFALPAPAAELPDHIAPSLWEPPRRVARRPRRQPSPEQSVLDEINTLISEGASLHTIAAALNRKGLTTGVGTRWTAATVARVLSDM
jgi:EAL domain-containing protein (putative c-di-GMP-specific phosphodiesterase class I)